MEMIILLAMCGGPVILVLIVLGVLAATKGRAPSAQAGPACTKCGGWTVPQANYCHWCGSALATGAAPSDDQQSTDHAN